MYQLLLVVGVISYNQPKLCPSATWNTDAITLPKGSASLVELAGIFINLDNNIYVTDAGNNEVLVWLNDGVSPTSIILNGLSYPKSIFVDIVGDIYVDNGNAEGRVDKWSSTTNTSVSVMSVPSSCYGLFVDTDDNLYCSIHNKHQVVTRWLYSNASNLTTVAGTGAEDSASDTLSYPYGIFVDVNFDLYVADYRNDRIQLFRSGELNGTTVAGVKSSNTTITLTAPTGVVLDADKYLFIVEYGNSRIVGSGPLGFRCIVGCSDLDSSESNKLSNPWSLSFDSHGSIFVTDWQNKRIQKFLLSTNSCSK